MPHDHHHHGYEPAPENRISEFIASGISENFRDWVRENNTNLIMWGAVPVYMGLSFLNKNPYFATGLALGAPLIMNDITENFMKAARKLEEDNIVSRRATSSIGAFTHAGSEIVSAGVNAIKGFAGEETVRRALAINFTSTFWSGMSHLGTMFFGAATFWRVGFPNKEEWNIHTKGIGRLTAGLGVPVIVDAAVQAIPTGFWNGAANVVNRGAGAILSYKSASWYMKKSEELGNHCIVHGPGCNGHHQEAPLSTNQTVESDGSVQVKTFRQRMNKIPKTAQLIVTHPAGKDAMKSTGSIIILSYGMLHNIDTLSQGFALATSAQGMLLHTGHSLPETLFMFKALTKGDRDMAIGALSGCMASIGVLGAVLLASGADIAESLRSTLSMAAYLTPPTLALAVSHENVMRVAGRVDEAASQWVKRNIGGRAKIVSDWLSNDGTSVARWIAVPATAAAIATTIALSSQNCHTHLDGSVDCGDKFNIGPDTQRGFGFE